MKVTDTVTPALKKLSKEFKQQELNKRKDIWHFK